ncbi:MAG: hypothetical protein KC432_15075, partial [Thermomicrobiales bacterium]|nr:hypothetical protein [Thermomicrobiales bacterium]
LSRHVGVNVSNVIFVVAGIVVILAATGLSIRTFMVPGEAPPFYNRTIFRLTQLFFNFASRFTRSQARKHQFLSLYAPISLLLVLASILAFIGFGYTLAFYGVGIKPFIRAFLYSGSAISTLGFESPGSNFWVIMLSALEALTVATIVALLVGYLPNIYSAYQIRESAVTKLHNLAGPAPDGVSVVDTYVKTYGYENLGSLWETWQEWFQDLAHSGSTLAGELYMRSTRWDRSWVTTAGAVLDAAALTNACVDVPSDASARVLISVGSSSLNSVLESLHLRCPADTAWPDTATNISRDEFSEALQRFKDLDIPIKPDEEAAWNAFARQRVQYECQLMALVRLKKPPSGVRWTSDRPESQEPLALPIIKPRHVVRPMPLHKAAKAAKSARAAG